MSSSPFLRGVLRSSALAALVFAAASSAAPASKPGAVAAVESEPTLKLADFAGLPAASGPGYRIDPSVPVQGYQGQFTVHTDTGDVAADGSDMLRQRVAEVG